MSEKEAPRYLYEFADDTGKMRYVDARNKEQAIAHVYKPKVRTLSARDALTIARNPNIVVETAGEKLPSLELPLAAPEGVAAAQADAAPPDGEAPAQAEPEAVTEPVTDTTPPADEVPKKKGLFGLTAA